MVYLAEQGLARLAEGNAGLTLDPAWQEMLNHATHRVNQVRYTCSLPYTLNNVSLSSRYQFINVPAAPQTS